MRPMPLPHPLESGGTQRPLALAHPCECAPCGTNLPFGPWSLRLSSSQAGRGRALRARATRKPSGTPAAPPRWSPGSGQSASQGGQPLCSLWALIVRTPAVTASQAVGRQDPGASVSEPRLVWLFATPAGRGACSDLLPTDAAPLHLVAGFPWNTAHIASCSIRPPPSHPSDPRCARILHRGAVARAEMAAAALLPAPYPPPFPSCVDVRRPYSGPRGAP